MTSHTAPAGPRLGSNRAAVLVAFFAQGFVFISATLFIPRIIAEFGLTPSVFSLFLLGMVLAAAVGSMIAEAVARRAGSAAALRTGLVIMAPAMALLFATGSLVGVGAGMVLYGIALGMVDAGSNMQAVTLERRYGRPILPSSQAAWTVGGLVATLASFAGMAGLPLSAGAAFAVVPVIATFMQYQGRDVVVPGPTAAVPSGPTADVATRIPWAMIAPAGIAFLLFYLVDSATQAWGPVFLTRTLDAPMQLVAAATLPYLAATLLARLSGDALTARFGAPALIRVGAVVASAGLAVVALAPSWPFAAAGFFATGLGLGVVAPLSFSAAGQIAGGDRARADVVVARFNQLNYVGALLGSVATGLIGGLSLRIGFAIPIILVLALIPLARGFAPVPARPSEESD